MWRLLRRHGHCARPQYNTQNDELCWTRRGCQPTSDTSRLVAHLAVNSRNMDVRTVSLVASPRVVRTSSGVPRRAAGPSSGAHARSIDRCAPPAATVAQHVEPVVDSARDPSRARLPSSLRHTAYPAAHRSRNERKNLHTIPHVPARNRRDVTNGEHGAPSASVLAGHATRDCGKNDKILRKSTFPRRDNKTAVSTTVSSGTSRSRPRRSASQLTTTRFRAHDLRFHLGCCQTTLSRW